MQSLIEEAPEFSRGMADRTQPLIEAWAVEPREAVRRLNSAGLSDPFSWCRTYAELSTGQQARFDAVDLLFGTSPLVVIDEFCSTIDSTTAAAVAWSIGRLARTLGRTLVVASCNSDYVADLKPDMVLTCTWSGDVEVSEPNAAAAECSILERLTYRAGSRSDWNKLRSLHYAAGDPATTHSIHVLDVESEERLGSPPGSRTRQLAAVAILSYPDLHSSARNLATDSAYSLHRDTQAVYRLNREVLKLSRLVVTPELRGCGIAARLVSEIITRTTARYVECVTAVGRYTGFLAHLGFAEIPQAAGLAEADLLDWATRERIPAVLCLSAGGLAEHVGTLSVRRQREARRVVWRHYHQFVLHRRTRSPVPKKIPDPGDRHWTDAWTLAAARMYERPSYWIVGPLH